ncbi:chorismate mutase [Pseudonocardiaceae bacterium YIM PH 21723]|nr:chorismate mutase [Pseudonocardiaceae bacterium YIM PH 21723]
MKKLAVAFAATVLLLSGCSVSHERPSPNPDKTQQIATPNTDQFIEQQRERIDEIDQEVAGLLKRRQEISQSVQRARTNDGGSRVDPKREEHIREVYRKQLGDAAGDKIAQSMLEAFRGQAPATPAPAN